MIDFFFNIGQWIWQEREAILMAVTSTQFLSLITALVMIVRNTRSNKTVKDSNKSLEAVVNKNNELSESTVAIRGDVTTLLANDDAINAKFAEYEQKVDGILNAQTDKLNVILEVLGIVYSTVKDERIRSTVNSLLTNARYNESNTKAELQRQVNDLKATVAQQLAIINKTVEEGVASVNQTIDPSAGAEETPMRY